LKADVPKAVSDAVLKCLAVNPADRYQSASEILRDLDLLAGGSVSAAPPSLVEVDALPQKRTWKWVSAGLAASLAIVLVLAFVFRDRFTPVPCRRTSPSRSWWPTSPMRLATQFSRIRWNRCSTSPWKGLRSSTLMIAGWRAGLRRRSSPMPLIWMRRWLAWSPYMRASRWSSMVPLPGAVTGMKFR